MKMPVDVVVSLISSLLGGLLVAIVNYIFTRKKTAAEAKKLEAEVQKIRAETNKIKVETGDLTTRVDKFTASPGKLLNSLLFVIYRHLEQGEVSEVLGWFEQFSEKTLLANTELALVYGSLGRLGGTGKAFGNLQVFNLEDESFYEIAQYELALLKYSKGSLEILPSFDIENLTSPELQKLWASLLALNCLRDQDLSKARCYFEMIESMLGHENTYDAYASLQIGIVAASLSLTGIADKFLFDLARKINRGRRFPVHGYPYTPLVAKHNRAFVLTILGKRGSELKRQDIQLLRGYSHFVANCSHTMRLCDSALDTVVKISETWPQTRLRKEEIKQRLLEFENYLLSNAGTLFLRA